MADDRFAHAAFDPRFSSAKSKSNRQRASAVLKDKRFDRMYKDPNFLDGEAPVDKYGRKVEKTSTAARKKHLKNFYGIEEESDDDGDTSEDEESDDDGDDE